MRLWLRVARIGVHLAAGCALSALAYPLLPRRAHAAVQGKVCGSGAGRPTISLCAGPGLPEGGARSSGGPTWASSPEVKLRRGYSG